MQHTVYEPVGRWPTLLRNCSSKNYLRLQKQIERIWTLEDLKITRKHIKHDEMWNPLLTIITIERCSKSLRRRWHKILRLKENILIKILTSCGIIHNFNVIEIQRNTAAQTMYSTFLLHCVCAWKSVLLLELQNLKPAFKYHWYIGAQLSYSQVYRPYTIPEPLSPIK